MSDDTIALPPISEGQHRRPRDPRGNRKRYKYDEGAPKLQFGDRGELTAKTIRQANLNAEEKKRAFEMLKVQAAYLEILDCLSYPVDPEGHVHDLSQLGPTKVAIAWTMALNGFRSSGKKYIKKRSVPGSIYEDGHTWVDIRAADDAQDELRPEDNSNDHRLPPDTRRLAAMRDGDPGQQFPELWKVKPKIIRDDEPIETKE